MTNRLRELVRRILGTFARPSGDLEEELRFHLEMAEQDAVRRGASRREGRVRAGAVLQAAEATRDQSGLAWVRDAWRDARLAVRSLAKRPQFASVAILSLALGIGANTAIFSVLNAAFLRPLPYAAPARIVWAAEHNARRAVSAVMLPDYAAWARRNRSFERISAYLPNRNRNLSAAGRTAQLVPFGRVTPEFFSMLGVRPSLGRDFAANEGEPGHNSVLVISDALWRGFFQSSPDLPGITVFLDGAPYTVIGVMPRGFVYPGDDDDRAALWAPDAASSAASLPPTSRVDVWVIGRLKPGVSLDQARADLEVIARDMDSQYARPFAAAHAASHVRLQPLQEHLAAASRTAIFLLMGAVVCILAIVCANLASLSLARSLERGREIAIRAAIGASRFHVVRLLLSESLVLSAAGGVAGIMVAYWTASFLGFLLPATIPRPVPVDARVLIFAIASSLGSGGLLGIAPALLASRFDVHSALKEGGAASSTGPGYSRLRGLLVTAQLALCLVLLVGAGLLLRTLVNLQNVPLGFDPDHVLLANFHLRPANLYGPARQREFSFRVLDAVRALAAVESVALTTESPVGAPVIYARGGLHAEGEPEPKQVIYMTSASDTYFRALRIPLIAGRPLRDADGEGQEHITVLSRSAARLLFGRGDPIGRTVLEPDPFSSRTNRWTVVGVVADIRHDGREGTEWPEIYLPFAQAPSGDPSLVVRSLVRPETLAPLIRKAAAAIDPSQPAFGIETMQNLLRQSEEQRRQRAFLVGIFAALALLVAAVGVHGVMAYAVTRRTHEIGVRVAMGASRSHVLALVLREGLWIALSGIAAGSVLSLMLARTLAGFLFGVGPRDPGTYALIVVSLLLAIALASYMPARRALRIDPIRALRHE